MFRARHLAGTRIEGGCLFTFDVHLFDNSEATAQSFIAAFSLLADYGLGRARARVRLENVQSLDGTGAVGGPGDGNEPIQIDLTPRAGSPSRVRVRFITPTELKGGDVSETGPAFALLARRVRDRIGTLRELYGPGPLNIDFKEFGERAAAIRATAGRISEVQLWRRSTRTGQKHSLGGFVGEVEYEGDLTEFLAYLEAARWTGVGRQTVWGKGELAFAFPDPISGSFPAENADGQNASAK